MDEDTLTHTYRYRLFCVDCEGDPQGCFGGGCEESEQTYETPELAAEAAYAICDHVAPWEYEVIDEEGKVIET